MKTFIIKAGETKLATLYTFFEHFPKNKGSFLDELVRTIPDNRKIGVAGFSSKKFLRECLERKMFSGKVRPRKLNIQEERVVELAEAALSKCRKQLRFRALAIFVFPTFSLSVAKELRGVDGYTPWKNTIFLFLSPSRTWRRAFQETLAHELAHAVSLNYLPWRTFLDTLVFEGIAEHFRESTVGGKKAAWAKAVPSNRIRSLFQRLANRFNSTDFNLYQRVFLGGKDFAKWTGYTLGYALITSFLHNSRLRDWNKLLRLPPKKILTVSDFKVKSIPPRQGRRV